MKNFLLGLLDWIYKKRCYFCNNSFESSRMCSKCYGELELNYPKISRSVLDKNVYCAGIYDKFLQKLIRGLKYHNQKDLAYFQAKFMFEYWGRLNIAGDFQIVPVPLFKARQKKRKYNHMELVAQEFSRLSGYQVNFDLIKRVKNTKPQYKLKIYEREENLKDAFVIDKTKLMDCNILLIDDICTTGSTFKSMIEAFKKEQIENITCFATTSAN